MNYVYEQEEGEHFDLDMIPQSERYHGDNHDSSRMLVSDIDEDDTSLVGAKHIGSYSPHAHHTTMAYDIIGEANRVTPQLLDSKEVLARTTGRNGTHHQRLNLPFCPALPDDGKTALTIEPRARSSQKLVDEYEVKYGRLQPSTESNSGHVFNACQTSKPVDSNRIPVIPKIHEPLPNSTGEDSHNLADCTLPNHYPLKKRHNPNPGQFQQRTLRRQEGISQFSHNIAIGEDKTSSNNNTTMPSKATVCLPRQRSRAIAIKRSRPGDLIDTHNGGRSTFIDKEAVQGDTELYDYATWRMYNRIIDHRRKNIMLRSFQEHADEPPPASKNQESSSNHHETSSASSTLDERSPRGLVHPAPARHGHPRYYHQVPYHTGEDYNSGMEDDGDEIFDLEL